MAVPFKTTLTELDIEGVKISVEVVTNIDELFTELASRSSDDPEVKDERIPYWAELWPSSILLAEYLVKNFSLIKGKKIIELGCGLGLSGIVAGKLGCKVLMTDYQQPALDFALQNWKRNNNEFAGTKILDWRHPDLDEKFDIILAADVAYESKMFRPLVNTIGKLLSSSGVVILTEPNRKFARDFLVRLQENGFYTETQTSVIRFRDADHTIHLHLIRRK